MRTRVESQLVKMRHTGYFEGIEQYISYFYPEPAALTDFFPEGGILFWDDPEKVDSEADSLLTELRDYQAALLLQGDILPGQVEICWNLKEILYRNSLSLIALTAFSRNVSHVKVSGETNIPARHLPSFMGRLDLLKEELKSWWSGGYEVFLICDGEKKAAGMERLLLEHGLKVSPHGDNIRIMTGRLENGFMIPSIKLVIIADKEILPQQRKKRRRTADKENGSLREFQ